MIIPLYKYITFSCRQGSRLGAYHKTLLWIVSEWRWKWSYLLEAWIFILCKYLEGPLLNQPAAPFNFWRNFCCFSGSLLFSIPTVLTGSSFSLFSVKLIIFCFVNMPGVISHGALIYISFKTECVFYPFVYLYLFGLQCLMKSFAHFYSGFKF